MTASNDRVPSPHSYRSALIIGQGRSGTNMLLDLLDLSPLTHCRSEPNAVPGCAFATLESQRFHVTDRSFLERHWDDVVDRSARSVGARDRRPPRGKIWARRWAETSRAFDILHRLRLRALLGTVIPGLRGNEVALPGCLVDSKALERALHVFKLNAACGLAEWVLERRPETRIIHIVRHPGGFARSWMKRWLRNRDADDVARRNLDRLDRVRQLDPAFALLQGDLARLSPLESELWFWRWCNDRVAAAGERHPAYRRILYEQVTARPLESCRELYGFCELTWTESVEAGVRRDTERSEEIAGAWRTELDADAIGAVRKVIAGSRMERWWDD